MGITCKTNFTAFQEDFRKRVARSKQSLPIITNRTALMVAKHGFDAVKVADRSAIQELGRLRYEVAGKSGKRLKRAKARWGQGQEIIRATNIFVAELRKRGIDPREYGPTIMQKMVEKWLSSRSRAVGSLKVAFIPVLKKLFSALNESQSLSSGGTGLSSFGPPRGHAEPAREGWNPVAKFDVSGGGRNDAHIDQVEKYLGEALDYGFSAVMKEWESYAEKQLNPILSE